MANSEQPITIKRHAGRLCHPGAGVHVTLEDLAALIDGDDKDFAVCAAKTGEDITRSVLRPIIRERGNHG